MKLLLVSLLFLTACASTRSLRSPEKVTSPECFKTFKQAETKPGNEQLDLVSELFSKNCYYETISLGEFLRSFQRDKYYNVTAEAAELFVPEGTVTEYVMETFERGYLAILMSLSYMRLEKTDHALVELRKAAQEQNAGLYNFGEDPIIAMLMAAIWDRFDSSMSRPFWKYLTEIKLEKSGNEDASLKLINFAQMRLNEIDRIPSEKVYWSIQGFGILPQLEWKSDLIARKNGPYKIYTREAFSESCQGKSDLFVSTDVWVKKIAIRYRAEYHPFLFAKSLARVPVSLGYGVLGTTAGVAVGVTGCGVSSHVGGDGLCKASIETAGSMIKASANLVEYTLKPDLRHWQKLPKAIAISRIAGELETTSACSLNRSAMLETMKLTP